MKKLYTMLAAAAAVSFGANAQDLVPEEVTLANPSMETLAEGVELDGNNRFVGFVADWQFTGASWYKEDGTASALCAGQRRAASCSDGNMVVRSGGDVSLEPGTYMWQEVLGLKPGTYVLQFDGQLCRNGWKGDYTPIEGAKGYAFICDDMGDPEEEGTAEEPAEGISVVYTTGQSNGNTFQELWRYYVVHTTHADLDEETGLKVGFGIPMSSVGISKGRLACDNFHLLYFDTMDTEAVKAYVNAEIEKVKAGEYSNPASPEEGAEPAPVPMNVANGTLNFPLNGFVTNSGYETEGVNDITVAPEFVGNNKYYNLQGIEVADPTQPGLYIHNGKKILVK